MDYSIVVATNSRPYCLERLLKSVSLLPAPKSIIVGNSTPDNAPDWVHEWYNLLSASSNLCMLRLQPNRCPGGARRDLISVCETPYVLLLDDDVVITPSSVRIFEPLEDGRADIVGGPWLQERTSDYSEIMAKGDAQAVRLENISLPDIRVVPIGSTYSFSPKDIEPRYVIKARLSCSASLDTLIFVDDLVPNIATKTDTFKQINFDERFLYFFEWYDFSSTGALESKVALRLKYSGEIPAPS